MTSRSSTALLSLTTLFAISLAPALGAADYLSISKKPYSEIVGDNPVATMETSDDVPAKTNVVGDHFVGDSWYEAGITITTDSGLENALTGWHVDDDPTLGNISDNDILLILDEPATEFGFYWGWGFCSGGNATVTLYSDTNHSAPIGTSYFCPASDGETPSSKSEGYNLGVLSTEAFQSVRIAASSTHATIDDLVYVAAPEPGVLLTQLAALFALTSVVLFKSR
jgi:hypothetical protein